MTGSDGRGRDGRGKVVTGIANDRWMNLRDRRISCPLYARLESTPATLN